MTLNASPPGDLSLALTGALDMIGSSLGNPNLLALYGAIDCGDQSQLTTTGTACTVRSPILSATIRSVGDGRFQLAYRVRLPGS
jgi:hypothetical protein